MARPRAGEETGRQRLLDAAWSALEHTDGRTDRISVSSLCAAAHCTAPTLYHHFDDVPALLYAAGQRAFAAWSNDMAVRVGAERDPALRLRRRARAYLDWAQANPRAYQVLFGSFPAVAAAPTPGAGPGAGFLPLRDDVAALTGLPAEDPAVIPVALAHWAAVHGIASLAIQTTQVPAGWWDTALDVLVEALLARR